MFTFCNTIRRTIVCQYSALGIMFVVRGVLQRFYILYVYKILNNSENNRIRHIISSIILRTARAPKLLCVSVGTNFRVREFYLNFSLISFPLGRDEISIGLADKTSVYEIRSETAGKKNV